MIPLLWGVPPPPPPHVPDAGRSHQRVDRRQMEQRAPEAGAPGTCPLPPFPPTHPPPRTADTTATNIHAQSSTRQDSPWILFLSHHPTHFCFNLVRGKSMVSSISLYQPFWSISTAWISNICQYAFMFVFSNRIGWCVWVHVPVFIGVFFLGCSEFFFGLSSCSIVSFFGAYSACIPVLYLWCKWFFLHVWFLYNCGCVEFFCTSSRICRNGLSEICTVVVCIFMHLLTVPFLFVVTFYLYRCTYQFVWLVCG